MDKLNNSCNPHPNLHAFVEMNNETSLNRNYSGSFHHIEKKANAENETQENIILCINTLGHSDPPAQPPGVNVIIISVDVISFDRLRNSGKV